MADQQDLPPPSELGTKEYWDNQYETEKKNFDEVGDKGEVWYGEAAMNRMVRWIEKNIDSESKIIDLGCGNGLMSIELYEAGFHNVDGVDYSENAIDLANKLAQDSNITDLNFFKCDILSPLQPELVNKYMVCVDKGTYDAISLSKDKSLEMRQVYRSAVHQMLLSEEPSFFFITSVNWTEEELKTFFGTHFSAKTVLPTPKFQFGGATGSTVTSIQIEDSTIKDQKILQRELYEKELDGIMDVLKMPSEDRVDTNILPMIKKLLEQVDTDHYTNVTSIIFSRKKSNCA